MIDASQLTWGPPLIGSKSNFIGVMLHGSMIRVYSGRPDSPKQVVLKKTKLVSPDAIALYYHIIDGTFDDEAWSRLSDDERDLIAYIAYCLGKSNRELNIAISRSHKDIMDRLRIIEGSIRLGNLNESLVREYNEILDRLSNSGQMLKTRASHLRNCMTRTFNKQRREAADLARQKKRDAYRR